MGCGASAGGKKYKADDAQQAAEVVVDVAQQAHQAYQGNADAAADPVPAPAPAPTPAAGGARLQDGGQTGDEDMSEVGEEVADLERDEILEAVDLDVDQVVTRSEWVAIMSELDVDATEANSMYEDIAQEAVDQGLGSFEEGVPLSEFLEELKIEYEDTRALQAVAQAAQRARAKLEAGEVVEPSPDELDQRALPPALDKVVRELDKAQRPIEDAWAICQEGTVPFSKAQTAAVATFEGREDEFTEQVKACALSPPLISSLGGQNACHELCVQKVNEIIENCQAEGTQFTDPEWDMNSVPEEVLYVDKAAPGWDCTVAAPAGYKRLTEIIEEPVLFKGGVRAGDIIQGQIGTCFLLGAMGAIVSTKQNAIKKMFMKYDVSAGVYGVRFNLDGEWMFVIVDDWMPVDENGQLLYARSKDPQEVWCPLLEKAYCKLHTCYEMCDGGTAAEAIFNFFGGVNGDFAVEEKHRMDPGSYFTLLKQAKARGWLLATHFQPKEQASGGAGKCGEATFESGLVGGHCYSVLKVVEAMGERLICCRNPWGTGEWRGKWSDLNSEDEWTDEMKEAVGYSGLDDGKFWMSLEDFLENSGGVSYARSFGPDWKKITQYKRFQQGGMVATAKFAYEAAADDEIGFDKDEEVKVKSIAAGWWYGSKVADEEAKEGFFPGNYVALNDRPIARFDLIGTKDEALEGPMTAVVMLVQPDASRQRKFHARKEDGMNYKDTSYPCMRLCIVNPEGQVQMKKVGWRRCLWGELKLPGGGQWRIYAYSVSGLGDAFSLRVYVKGGTATLEEVPGADISELQAAIEATS